MNQEVNKTADILSQAIEQRQKEHNIIKGLHVENDSIFENIEIVNEATLNKEVAKRAKKVGGSKVKRPLRNGLGRVPAIGARFMWTVDMVSYILPTGQYSM
jgi:hypothetical protein